MALPRGCIREIASVTADFHDMRRQLDGPEAAERAEAKSALHAAEEALHLRDVRLRTLAHDLKVPLAALMWHVQVLQHRARSGRLDPAALDEGFQAIALGAGEAISAIDELHDLMRLAAGAPLRLRREPVDLVVLARRVVKAHPEFAMERLYVESSEPNLVIDGDPARLARVLRNLLDNATKYSARDQPVTVSVLREQFEGATWATLRVRDAGIGIPSADLPYIFELYHRARNAAAIGGEGLGLVSVRQLVELHGGHVDVQSEEGVGSVFSVWLPPAAVAKPWPPGPEPAPCAS